MRTLFVALAVVSFVAPAVAGDLRAEVIEKIDSMRDEESKRDYRVVLPETIPEISEDARLRVEFALGHYSVSLGRIDFAPGEKAVTVSSLAYGSYILGMRDLAFRGIGITYSHGGVTPEKYRALAAKLMLVKAAKLEWREGRTPSVCRSSSGWTTSDGKLHVNLTAGKRPLIAEEFRVTALDPREVLATKIDDTGRALFYLAFVLEAVTGMTDREVSEADRSRLVTVLTTELGHLADDVPDYRRRLRVASLGVLGYADAIPAIQALAGHKSLARDAKVAIRKIEILNLEDPKKALEALMNHPIPDLRDWGEAVMKQRYEEEHRAAVIALFTSEDPTDRLEAVSKLYRLDPEDITLARKGLTDPHPLIRVRSAAMVWDVEKKLECTKILLAVAADKSLTSRDVFYARTGAIEALTWHGAKGTVEEIRKALEAIALDEKDDVTARGSALLGLGYLGDRKAIPAVLEVFVSKVPEKPVYLHDAPGWVTEDMIERARGLGSYIQTDDVRQDAARTLGILRAKLAVPVMTKLLTAAPVEYEGNLRMWVAMALARIGDPRGRAALETWGARQTDRMRKDEAKEYLALHTALTSKVPAKALLEFLKERGSWSDSIWIEIALADLADDKRLAELSEADYGDGLKELIAAARSRKR